MKQHLQNDSLICSNRISGLVSDLVQQWMYAKPPSGVEQEEWDTMGQLRAAALIEAAEQLAEFHLRMLQHDPDTKRVLLRTGEQHLGLAAKYAGDKLRAKGVLLPRNE